MTRNLPGRAPGPAPRIVMLSAGLGSPSSTRLLGDRLVESVQRALAREGSATAQVDVVELRQLARDIADHLVSGFPPPGLRTALDRVAAADGLIAVSPVFSASYSGLFKSFFDVLDRDALTGTPVLIAATGGTPRHSLVTEHAMRPLFAHLRATVAPTAVYASSQDWGADGLEERIALAGHELAALLGTPGRAPGEVAGVGGGAGRAAGGGGRGPSVEAILRGDAEVVPFEEQLAALRQG